MTAKLWYVRADDGEVVIQFREPEFGVGCRFRRGTTANEVAALLRELAGRVEIMEEKAGGP